MRRTVAAALALAVALVARTAGAHGEPLGSLQDLEVPAVPGLLSGHTPIVRNRAKAIALGKAFGETSIEGTLQPPRWEWPAR